MKGRRSGRGFKNAALLPALLLCVLNCGGASAQDYTSSAAGTATAQFLKIASGARGAGLGEAYSALVNDAFALDWNPAGLTNIPYKSLVFMHSPYLAGTYVDYFGYAENAGEVGAWGISGKYMNYGEISKTDSSGLETGTLNPNDMAFTVGFSCYITGFNKDPEDRFVLGATGKFVRSTIQDTDNTISADLGLLSPMLFDGAFRMSFAAQNIMGSMRFDKEDALLPLILRLGSVTKLGEHFTLATDVIAARDNMPYLASGLEAGIKASKDIDVALRGGFNTRSLGDLSGSRNFAVGAGLRYGEYTVDYAFSPFGAIGSVHRISISIAFSEPVVRKY